MAARTRPSFVTDHHVCGSVGSSGGVTRNIDAACSPIGVPIPVVIVGFGASPSNTTGRNGTPYCVTPNREYGSFPTTVPITLST